MTFKMNVLYRLQYIYTCFHDMKGLHIRGKITEEQLTGTGLKRVNDFQIKKSLIIFSQVMMCWNVR